MTVRKTHEFGRTSSRVPIWSTSVHARPRPGMVVVTCVAGRTPWSPSRIAPGRVRLTSTSAGAMNCESASHLAASKLALALNCDCPTAESAHHLSEVEVGHSEIAARCAVELRSVEWIRTGPVPHLPMIGPAQRQGRLLRPT